MTALEQIIVACRKYIDNILGGYKNTEKSLAYFEKEYMEKYSGDRAVDHVLFRTFLRQYDPEEIIKAAKDQITGETANKEIIEVENEAALKDVDTPREEVIYITKDTHNLYIWNGSDFINVTNTQIDDTIYVNDLDTLLDYGAKGMFTVILVETNQDKRETKVYTLQVASITIGEITAYHPILSNIDGWADVAKNEKGNKYWDWHTYVYKTELDELRKIAYAGL